MLTCALSLCVWLQRVPHLLGLDLEGLSHGQLDALDEMHTALLRSITEHRIALVQVSPRTESQRPVVSSRDSRDRSIPFPDGCCAVSGYRSESV